MFRSILAPVAAEVILVADVTMTLTLYVELALVVGTTPTNVFDIGNL